LGIQRIEIFKFVQRLEQRRRIAHDVKLTDYLPFTFDESRIAAGSDEHTLRPTNACEAATRQVMMQIEPAHEAPVNEQGRDFGARLVIQGTHCAHAQGFVFRAEPYPWAKA
jgi:hypothetical protein